VSLLYVYGVVSSTGPALSLPAGVDASRPVLQRGSVGELAAVVSPIPRRTVHARARDVRAHEAVLRAALEQRDPVLPLRFGAVYENAADVDDRLLAPASDELVALLAEFRGLVELELRAIYPDEEALLRELVRSEPALARLRERSRRGGYPAQLALGEAMLGAYQRRRAADTSALLERLGPLARAWQARETVPERVAAQISFLVERAHVSAFDRAAEELAREELRLSLAGPLPPYSFLSFELDPAAVA
jgi:hypothetical protein